MDSSSESPHNEPEHHDPNDSRPAEFAAYIASLPPMERWTTDGYPIVDGKYHNLETGEVMTHTGDSDLGPPHITIYWQNRVCTGRGNQFLVKTRTIYSTRNLSEYIIRIGNLLQSGVCKVDSLNATPYSVYVVVASEGTQAEFSQALEDHGLT